ncbi:hypothetical protein TNCV_4181061 [Trichonephila clavipes]|nr:hypothetical protein TNCV_4181061 [Trichonephila clavipes]
MRGVDNRICGYGAQLLGGRNLQVCKLFPFPGVSTGSSNRRAPECVVYPRWCTSTFFYCSAFPPPFYISREVEWT